MEISTHLWEPGHLELFVAEAAEAGASLPAIIVLAEMDAAAQDLDRELARGLARSGYAVLLVARRALQSESFASLLARLEALPSADTQRLALLGSARVPSRRCNSPPSMHTSVRSSRWRPAPVHRRRGAHRRAHSAAGRHGRCALAAVEMADQIIERLATHRFAHGVSLHSYGEAGHRLFGPPLARVDPTAQRLCEFGGTLEGNLRARRDSWRKTLDFLEDCIGCASGDTPRSILVHDEG